MTLPLTTTNCIAPKPYRVYRNHHNFYVLHTQPSSCTLFIFSAFSAAGVVSLYRKYTRELDDGLLCKLCKAIQHVVTKCNALVDAVALVYRMTLL